MQNSSFSLFEAIPAFHYNLFKIVILRQAQHDNFKKDFRCNQGYGRTLSFKHLKFKIHNSIY